MFSLDADGFPVAVSAQQHDLQAGASGDAAGTELLFVQQLEAEAEEQLQQHAMLAQEQQVRGRGQVLQGCCLRSITVAELPQSGTCGVQRAHVSSMTG